MIYRTPIILLAALLATTGCNKKKPSTKAKPPAEEPRTVDSIEDIGLTAAGHVELWVFTLSQVKTEEDAKNASKRLDLISNQFDLLAERAKELPKLSEAEFKSLDRKIDTAIGKVSGGLEIERRRIFLMPDEVKSAIIPTHEKLLKKFRATSRAIKAIAEK